jgi:hypothetical protein
VPAFTSSEHVLEWLTGKPRDLAIILVARAAIRAIPTLATEFKLNGGALNLRQRNAVLIAFRCAATAWSAVAYRGEAKRIRSVALSTAESAAEIFGPGSQVAAGYACMALGVSDTLFPNLVSESAKSSLKAASDVSRQALLDMLNSFAADADVLNQGYDPATLALSTVLWPSVPDWAFEAWARLERALLEAHEDWEVWTDWYEARLKAGGADQAIEVARVTIPSEIWDQGPKVVNGQIRRWLEERGIWQHEAAAESHREAPAAPNNNDDVVRRLMELSREELEVISARAAMRAIPLADLSSRDPDNPEFADAVRSMFGAAAVAWFAARYPGHPENRYRVQTGEGPFGTFPMGAFDDDLGIVTAGLVVSTAQASLFNADALNAADGIVRMTAIAGRADGRAGAAMFDSAFSDDLRDLESAPAAAIAELPLWPGNSPPSWIIKRWEHFKRRLISLGVGWEAWINWYEDRLAGRSRSDEQEFVYAKVPDEFWADGAVRVNAWILKTIDDLMKQLGPGAFNDAPEADFPRIPSPGPGPRFQAGEQGPIDRAPPSDLDVSGNDVRTINQLKPLVERCVAELRTRISRNEFPELLTTVEQYDAVLHPSAGQPVEWGELWGLGVILQNAASAAERQIVQRLLPPMEDPIKTALDSLLRLHGPLILATKDGAQLAATALDFSMTREEQADLRAASQDIAR